MPTADLRPLLRANPTDPRLLGVGLGLEVELHSARNKDLPAGSRPWEIDGKAKSDILRMARAHLVGLEGWLVEPYSIEAIASTLPDPSNLDARIEAGHVAALALADGAYRLDATGIVRWMMLPALMRGRFGWQPDLAKFDPARALEFAALRRRSFAPWLDGRLPVRNLDAFRAFHLILDPAEQTVVKSVAHPGSVTLKDPSVEPATAWAWDLRSRLVSGGWVKELEKPTPGAPSQWLLTISTQARRLATGEFGQGY